MKEGNACTVCAQIYKLGLKECMQLLAFSIYKRVPPLMIRVLIRDSDTRIFI